MRFDNALAECIARKTWLLLHDTINERLENIHPCLRLFVPCCGDTLVGQDEPFQFLVHSEKTCRRMRSAFSSESSESWKVS